MLVILRLNFVINALLLFAVTSIVSEAKPLKHFALFANTFREGVDLAVQITMDRPEPGGLSGAPLEEAVSWSKVKPEGKMVTVICDTTIAFPLIVAAALERIH